MREYEDFDREEKRIPKEEYTLKERFWFAMGALKASLLIGLVYLAGFALLIGLMLLLWGSK